MNLFTAVVQKEDALYVAQCLEVGTTSQEETIEDDVYACLDYTTSLAEEQVSPIEHAL